MRFADPATLTQTTNIGEGTKIHLCSVMGCHAGACGIRPQCSTFDRLRSHIDGHLLGLITSKPPNELLTEKNMRLCSLCSKSVRVRSMAVRTERAWQGNEGRTHRYQKSTSL